MRRIGKFEKHGLSSLNPDAPDMIALAVVEDVRIKSLTSQGKTPLRDGSHGNVLWLCDERRYQNAEVVRNALVRGNPVDDMPRC